MEHKKLVLVLFGDLRVDQGSMVVAFDNSEDTLQFRRDIETMMKHASIVRLGDTKIHYLTRPYTDDTTRARMPDEVMHPKVYITQSAWHDAFSALKRCYSNGGGSEGYYVHVSSPYPHGNTACVLRAAYEINQDLIANKKRSYDFIIAVDETLLNVDNRILPLLKQNE